VNGEAQALEEVLAQRAWIRRLAQRLVVDEAERDDIIQQAWVEALTKPNRARAVRPWLFGLVRNVARMELRRDVRRRHREEATAVAEATPGPDELVERVELERQVAAAVLAIAEPYRQTLLLRYYEELEPTEIARRLRIPAGTVRWRLKQALAQLRASLDEQFNGDRRRWGLALIPTAAGVPGGAAKLAVVTIGGALLMKALLKLIGGVLGLLLLLWGGLHWYRGQAPRDEVTRAAAGAPWRSRAGAHTATQPSATVEGVKIPLWFGQRGAAVRRIAGRVTSGGAPVDGATVELGSALSDAGVMPVITRRTGSDGGFDFGAQPPAPYSLAASARGHSPAVVEVDTRDPTSAAEHIELRLAGCDSALFGHVNDSSGGTIAGARVCHALPRANACVISDDKGNYEACLSPRQSAVEISARGYGTVDERVTFTSRRMQRDFLLTPEATIVGRVVRAADGSPVAGAQVRSVGIEQGSARWSAAASTVSDAQGRFTLTGLAPGRHRLSASADGVASSQWLELSVQAGRISSEIVLRLAATTRVSGIVTDGRDAVAGATVVIKTPLRCDAVTQRDGSFVLDNVSRGVQTLDVVSYEVREPKSLVVDAEEISGVRVVVELMASIAGTVTQRGRSFAGATVFGGRGISASSDDDGHYIIRGLTPGKYRLSAENNSHGAFGTAPDVTVAAGEQRSGIDIDLRYGGGIAGTIIEASGAPAGGVFVHFEGQHRPDGGDDVTAADGSFHVGTLMGDDDYKPYVRPAPRSNQRFEPATGDFPIVHVADGASQIAGVQLVIKRAHQTISGSVVDGEGQPLADVRISATRSDAGEAALPPTFDDRPSAISAVDGGYAIADLDAGRYTLDARGGDGSEAHVENVAAGASGVVIKLRASGGIDGTLVGFATPPSVSAWPAQPNTWPVYATVSGTTFQLRGLAPGSYTVSTAGNGGAAESVQVQSGQNVAVTLRNRGSASVSGRVYDWRTGAGVPGLSCRVGTRAGDGMPAWDGTNSAISDASGHYALEGVAAGSVAVGCRTPNVFITDGMAPITLVDGQPGSVDIPVVDREPYQSRGSSGSQLDGTAFLVARVIALQPEGPAERAGLRLGDVITTVDGKTITMLTPWAVQSVIVDRAAGTTARLGITRSDAPINVVLAPSDGS
jgi:RNA polymerase sigma factor (sigma-70 family)